MIPNSSNAVALLNGGPKICDAHHLDFKQKNLPKFPDSKDFVKCPHFAKSWESKNLGRKFCPKCKARVHHKFQDPHFSSVTASQKSGITILAMHLQF